MHFLQKGCFCCELETCVKVQGYLSSVLSGIGILICIYIIAVTTERPKTTHAVDVVEARKLLEVLAIAAIVCLVVLTIYLILSILLLVGVYKRRRHFLLPFMAISVLNIILNLCIMFVMVSTAQIRDTAIQCSTIGILPHPYCELASKIKRQRIFISIAKKRLEHKNVGLINPEKD